jgi:peptidoglycan/LPS O-acetylase OafA/YrhL
LLGAISYSLYLVHVPVIMTMINLLGDRLPLPVVLSLVPPVSLVVAYGFYRLVEDPSTQAGQRLARRLSARPVEVPV